MLQLDDLADIARVTRTSRLLHYMTLPQLYRQVTLTAYPETRYINGRPEGFGSGSPFAMALSGLMTSNAAAYVKEFRVRGSWKESGVEEYSQGKVPDSTMLLNVVVRGAIDKMVNMESFTYADTMLFCCK